MQLSGAVVPSTAFQLTHPSRGATHREHYPGFPLRHFNSHTPRGVRPVSARSMYSLTIISTHTPLAGCDAGAFPTAGRLDNISTHTPLAGCDAPCGQCRAAKRSFQLTHPSRGATSNVEIEIKSPLDFNSHTPRGVRPLCVGADLHHAYFNSHTPRGVRLTLYS